jgi:hypothetical protein
LRNLLIKLFILFFIKCKKPDAQFFKKVSQPLSIYIRVAAAAHFSYSRLSVEQTAGSDFPKPSQKAHRQQLKLEQPVL